MTKFDSPIKQIVNVIYKNINKQCRIKAIFNVQIHGEHSVIGGEISVFENNSFSLLDEDNLIFKIFQEIHPYLKEIQKTIGENNEGNIYLKLDACDLKKINLKQYIDKDKKLKAENYLLWEFDELDIIQFPEDKFTINTLKKFNRIK